MEKQAEAMPTTGLLTQHGQIMTTRFKFLIFIFLFSTSPSFAAHKDYAVEYATGNELQVYTPGSPPPAGSQQTPWTSNINGGGYALSNATGNISMWTNDSAYLKTESDPKVGSLTTNYVPHWNGTTLANGAIYDNGTNVGIGTTSTTYPLNVGGVVNIPAGSTYDINGSPLTIGDCTTGNCFTGTTGTTLTFYSAFGNGTLSYDLTGFNFNKNMVGSNFLTSGYLQSPIVKGGSGTTSTLTLEPSNSSGATTGSDIIFKVGVSAGTEAARILNNGNVGIGTVSPGYKLDVNGDVNIATGSHYKINGSNLTYTDVGAQVAGSYEVPLTFSTGLTRSTNTITNNLSVGVSGGQTAIGGTAASNSLTLSSTSNATKGSILFGTSAYDEVNNRLGIGTATPTNALSYSGQAARTWWLERHITANTAGNSLTLQAGGATTAATNKNGGDLLLYPGASTGSGTSNVRIYSYPGTAGATSDNTAVERLTVLGNGNVGIGVTTPANTLDILGVTSSTSTGVLNVLGGVGIAGTVSGQNVTILSGQGKTWISSSQTKGSGGGFNLQGGAGGDLNDNTLGAGSYSAGVGGAFIFSGGNGGAVLDDPNSSAVTLAGGNGGDFLITSGFGQDCLLGDNTKATGGQSGGIQLTTNYGGNVSSKSVGIGGNTGAFTFSSNSAGTVSARVGATAATGGNSGGLSISIGAGGATSKLGSVNAAAVLTGGNSGALSFTQGNGGAATGTGSGTAPATSVGGNAGTYSFTGGNGGAATGGTSTNTGGNAGNMTFQVGIGGTGASANGTNGHIIFKSNTTEIARFDNTAGTVGRFGIGIAPTAMLHIKAGTATAGTAPIKLAAGVVLTTPESGVFETDSSNNPYFTNGTPIRARVHFGGFGSVTLTAGTTTTVTDASCKTTSTIIISPTSLAVIALTPYVSTKNNGSFVITTGVALGTETLDYVILN